MSAVGLLRRLAPEKIMTELETTYDPIPLWEDLGVLDDQQQAAKITVLVTTGDFGVSRAVMDQLPNLGCIVVYGVGYDQIDLGEARRRGIKITTTPDVLTHAVAEMALGLTLASLRHIVQGDQSVRVGTWNQGVQGLGRSLSDLKVGIVGMGRIGQRMAELISALGAPVFYYSRTPKPAVDYPHYDDLCACARGVDVLMIALSGGAETRHMINQDVLEALGPEGLLVNVARGSIVDEEALLQVLKTGRLGAAALDVFDAEPTVPEEFYSLNNVILTPHLGSAAFGTRMQMGRLVLDNIAAYCAGKPLVTPLEF